MHHGEYKTAILRRHLLDGYIHHTKSLENRARLAQRHICQHRQSHGLGSESRYGQVNHTPLLHLGAALWILLHHRARTALVIIYRIGQLTAETGIRQLTLCLAVGQTFHFRYNLNMSVIRP